jgi:hypothetical protein
MSKAEYFFKFRKLGMVAFRAYAACEFAMAYERYAKRPAPEHYLRDVAYVVGYAPERGVRDLLHIAKAAPSSVARRVLAGEPI